MRCSRCDNELSQTARFCGRCGVTISPSRNEVPAEAPKVFVPPPASRKSEPVEASQVPSGGGVLLLEAPAEPRPPRRPDAATELRPDEPPAIAQPRTPTVRTRPTAMVCTRPTAMVGAIVVAAMLVAGLFGAFVGHRGTASAAAEAAQLRARLADAATAQASLTDQVGQMTKRLAAQKSTEPLRRLVGKRTGEVQSYAQSHGWQLRVVRVGSGRPPGTVLTQSPPAGHVMKPGGPIVVRVAA